VRGLRYHLRVWGPADAPPHRRLVMLHGWMDVSASFQFVVDALAADWQVIAPDWRGYGHTQRPAADCYWFPDYLADLESILDVIAPSEPAVLVGHSMGGNVALLYAGTRPRRVRAVLNLEGFGLRGSSPEQTPERYAQWLDQLKAGGSLRDYATLAEVTARLRSNNPRLSAGRAEFLAQHWAEPDGAGRYRIAGDPAHRIVNPVLYRVDEALACWRRIECPVLWVVARESEVLRYLGEDRAAALAELDRRRAAIGDVEQAEVADAGHMLHHDQPEAVARVIEEFVDRRFEARAQLSGSPSPPR
jgi:pimeloyl-ACP methyl ester carboxylesterase